MKKILFVLLVTFSVLSLAQETDITNEDRSSNSNKEEMHELLIMKSRCTFSGSIEVW